MSSFEDIVSNYDAASDLYAAVVRAEQEHPDALPVIVGLKAWAMLDDKQRQASRNDLLQAYVTVVRTERAEGTQQALDDAMADYNAGERTGFRVATKSLWLGLDGPAYQVGDVRAKALFLDTSGRHWVDGALVAESMAHVAGDPAVAERYREVLCHPDVECHDLWVFTDTRGRWNALMVPVDVIAHEFGYPPPVLLPGDNWGRCWWDMPERSDAQELAWIAAGGKPTHSYQVPQL